MGLKNEAISGAKWTGTSKVATSVLQFGKLVVLGRILEPEAFGLMSMIMVVIGFAQAYMDMGISNAIIHKKNSSQRQLSTLYWINIFAGIVLFIIVNLATPLIVEFYREPRLSDLIFIVSFLFVITPIGQQFYILLQKQLRFKLLAIIEISAVLSGAVVAIALALKGYGVYSLVWGQLFGLCIRTLASLFVGLKEFRPTFDFVISEVREYLSFGVFQMGSKSANYFAKNIDYILIGRYFGSDILGAYTIAFQLIIKPVQKINPILTRVAFPIFSKYQHNNDVLRKGYFKLSKFLTFISYPLLIFIAFTAPLLIPVLMGDGWQLTISLIPVLALIGLVRTLGNPVGSIYLAKGRADIGFYFDTSIALINLLGFWIAVQFSIYHVAWTFALLNICYFIVHRFVVDLMIGSSWLDYLRQIWMNVIIAAASSLTVYLLMTLVLPVNLMGLIVVTMLMLIVFLLTQYLFNRRYLKEVFSDYLSIEI